MFKKLFKNKSVGFYISLAASLISLFLTIFYAAYMGAHGLFNGGIFVLYLFAFLFPLVYFFVNENDWTRVIRIVQTALLALAFGILVASVGDKLVYYLTGSYNIAGITAAEGAALLAVCIVTAVAMLTALVASCMRQTKPLTAEQQAEVDESWTSFKTNTKAFAVKHKKPLIISGAGVVALIVFIVLLFTLIVPAALYVHVDGIRFDKSEIVMYETETRVLKVTIDPENAENDNFTFKSSNEDVATVTSGGFVEAVGVGETTISATAEDGGHVAECKITVEELTVVDEEIVKYPTTLHYIKGETFSPSGISIKAELTNGETEMLNARLHNLKYLVSGTENEIATVDEKEVYVEVSYEYRGKTFKTDPFTVYGDVAEVGDVTEFEAAYDNTEEYGYLRCTAPLEFDTLLFDNDIIVEGILSADAVTLSSGADVTIVGRLGDPESNASDTFTVSGSGSLDIQTEFGEDRSENKQGPMVREVAGLYATNGLTVSGVTLETTGIHAGSDIKIDSGADVTVLGPNTVKGYTYNGVETGSTVTVDNAKFTVLSAGETYVNRAALECNGVLVDNGGELVIDKSEDAGYHYGFAMWSGRSDCSIVVRNGSTAKFNAVEVDPGRTDNQCLCGFGTIEVLDTSVFEMNAVRHFNVVPNATFAGTASVTVDGVKMDMTQSAYDLVFGEMKVTDVSVIVPEKTYTEGDTFDGDGILLDVTFGTDTNASQLRVQLDTGFEAVEKVLEAGYNTVEVKVGDETVECEIFADFAESSKTTVSSAEDFNSALENDRYGYITVSGELTFDSLTIDRDIYVEGNIKVNGTLTVEAGATLNMIGRIWSDSDMTIAGGGTVEAMEYAPASGTLSRPEYAAIRTNGALTINGATVVNVSNIATGGDLTVTGGAKVTVYGKNAAGNDGKGVNGIHSSGKTVTVSGAGTELNVWYNAASNEYSPAAIEAGSVKVDGAKMDVRSLTGASWMFAIWFQDGDRKLEAMNGAQVTVDVDPGPNSVFGGSDPTIYATAGEGETATSITVVTPESKFQQSIVVQGSDLVHWQAK